MKKFLIIFSWVLFMGGILFLMSFSASKRDALKCRMVNIQIDFSEGNRFIEKQDIESLISERCDSILGKKVTALEITRLERLINGHPSVENTEVYQEIDGTVNIEITQRKPIIRIINARNENYYIDENGFLMPVSFRSTANVPAANGYITEGYAAYYGKRLQTGFVPDTLLNYTMLDELFTLGLALSNDEFMQSQVAQIYLNDKLDFEIIPRVGDHIIYLGGVNNLQDKFAKLKAFYKESINNGLINTYSVINLQYEKQVVCTKKI